MYQRGGNLEIYRQGQKENTDKMTLGNDHTAHLPSRKLGLLGNGIGRSSAPRLHRLGGALCGITVTYDLLDLQDQPPTHFAGTLASCATAGYWGVNVTYPYKEAAANLVTIADPVVRQLGAVNTVLFGNGKQGAAMQGYNTDYTGFLRAYQSRFGTQNPGVVGIVGTGGVGKPVAFGLAQVGATALHLYDLDLEKAAAVAAIVQQAMPHVAVQVCTSLPEVTTGVDGLVNCTPVGMYQHPGTPIPAALIGGQRWAFDVIYTPLETEFLTTARQQGLEILSGYELFFYQGVNAFALFTGLQVEEARLRAALAAPAP